MGVVKSPPLSDADRKRIAALWESAGRSAGPIVTLPNQCEVRPDGTVFVPRGADPATWLAAFAAPLADDAPVSVVEGSP